MFKFKKEKRIYPRYEHTLTVIIDGVEHYTQNISIKGCFVETSLPLSVGTVTDMTVLIGKESIRVKGIVRHVTTEGMGIEFLEIEREKEKAFLCYLKEISLLDRWKQSLFRSSKKQNGARIDSVAKRGLTVLEASKILLTVVILASIILPIINRSYINSRKNSVIQEFEKKRGSKVIEMIHAQETVSLLGIPVRKYITMRDAESVLAELRDIPDDKPIDFIIHTSGGQLLSAYQIANALKKHKGRVTVFIPQYAMSAGTLIALAADEIVMSPTAVLGPTDPQFMVNEKAYPAVSVIKIPAKKNVNAIDDETIILVDQAEKAIAQVKDMIKSLVGEDFKNLQELQNRLVGGSTTHDYPILYEDARKLGLPVSDKMPEEVYKILNFYLLRS